MIDAQSRELFDRFCDRTLPKSEWDHAAHLTVCWVALDARTPADTLAFLRTAIRSYNEATGVVNSETEGYHETITQYFVGAVADLAAGSVDEVIAADESRQSALLRHWSRDCLFSPIARARWVEPDLAPLPWGSLDRFGDRVSVAPTAPAPPRTA